MSKPNKIVETERKIELGQLFMEQAALAHLKERTWGKVTVVLVIECGYVRDLLLDDHTMVRDLPVEKLARTVLPEQAS